MNPPKGAFSTAPFSLFGTKLVFFIAILFAGLHATAARNPLSAGFYAGISSFAPSSGAPGTLIKIKGSGLAGATNVNIGNGAALIISTVDSTLTAMVMPGNVTGAVRVTTAGGAVLAAQATFTVLATPHPTAQMGPKLVDTTTYPKMIYLSGGTPPPGGVRYKSVNQGADVAVSADGNSAVVSSVTGLNYDNQYYGDPGSFTFYEKQQGKWKKTRFYAANSIYGVKQNTRLNADGTVLVNSGNNLEPTSVLEKKNGVWQKTSFFQFGSNADVSADGNTIILGYASVVQHRSGPEVNEFTTIYHRKNGSWTSDATPSEAITFGAGDAAGSVVAISGDAKTLAATSYFGYTYIMRFDGTAWQVQAKLPVAGGVTLNTDGNVLIESLSGSTSFYTRINGAWSKAQDIPETGKPSVTADTKVVMFPGYNGPVTYIRNTAGVWQKQDLGLPTSSASNVSISADGTTALSGFPDDASAGQILTKRYIFNTGSTTIPTDSTYITYPYGSATAYGIQPAAIIAGVSPATGSVGTVVKVKGTNLSGATQLTISGKKAVILSVNDNEVTAMAMPGTVNGSVSITTVAGTVSGGSFTVTPTLYPNVQKQPILADTTKYKRFTYEPQPYLNQGQSVAISADGKTALVGSRLGFSNFKPGGGPPIGGVSSYKNVDGEWLKDGVFPHQGWPGFGNSVALSGDGNTAVVGQLIVEQGKPFTANFFTRLNGVWNTNPFVTSFEVSGFAMTVDGNSIFATQGNNDRSNNDRTWSSAVLYQRKGNTWVMSDLKDNQGEHIVGVTVASVSADGSTLALAPMIHSNRYSNDFYPATSGIGFVYAKTDNGWQKQLSLEGILLGTVLSADGNVIVTRKMQVLVRTDTTWTLKQTLPEAGIPSISADGATIMITTDAGPVAYTRGTGMVWKKQANTYPKDQVQAAVSIALTPDATMAFIGNPRDSSTIPNRVRSSTTDSYSIYDFSLGGAYTYHIGEAVAAPGGYATLLNFTNTTATSTTLNWTNGPGGKRAVFLHVNAGSSPVLADLTTYTADAAAFSKGAQLGTTGWYCVYNGTGNTVNISNLTGGTKYYAVVIEYNGAPGLEKYYTTRMSPAYVVTPVVAQPTQASNLAFSNIGGTTSTVNWTNGSGTSRAVFISNSNSGAPLPANVYYSSNVRFGSGNQIGSSGWYCIYNGTGSTTNVIGLTSGGTYRVAVVEYNGTIDKPLYITNNIAPANLTTPITPPTAYTYGLTFSNTTFNSTKATWVSGNGTARAVFVRAGGKSAINPTTGVTYSANSTFGLGSQEGTSGWYCVYNGTANTTNIFGLSASSTYTVLVVEYNGTAGSEAYLKTGYNPASVTTTANIMRVASNGYNTTDLAPGLNGTGNSAVVANNILSPNGDGKNDTWIVSNIESYPENTVNVTDGGGNVVFSKKGYANDWAGTYRGGVLSEGTYYYTIDLGKSNLIKGFFTVVRDR
ncbi:hypothetical protein DYU05_01225 [Mucilaginibacter terrenus]|uniref:Fibronectin type-III domain-containing protein n=1 Tax=Mucilaginibacter terrenus TaxID=2482727 RepID=A0A3E2NTU8_9SPHI|nr:gliding motility-associated C-terminal domain-containing protein [Mucilaginibacter terrenus]RFZ84280.1 hypothetical protein DYU05_01225 [Mucilaginibacter terrenus]